MKLRHQYKKIGNIVLLCSVMLQLLACARQNILLIGTLHSTEKNRLHEIIPITSAIKKFKPEIFCVEYLLPTDSLSINYRINQGTFNYKEAIDLAWKLPNHVADTIRALQLLRRSLTIDEQIRLQQLYFLTLDMANADYTGYRLITSTPTDPSYLIPSENYQAKSTYENKHYRHDEYDLIVFPMAAQSNISYLYPIDDLSTWTMFEKFYDRSNTTDIADSSKTKYQRLVNDFLKVVNNLPNDSNKWILSNTPKVINDLLRIECYTIDSSNTNSDIKARQHYWVTRNQRMAEHIATVATKHKNKKVIVFVGASHVGAVREELLKLNNNYSVLTLFDVIK